MSDVLSVFLLFLLNLLVCLRVETIKHGLPTTYNTQEPTGGPGTRKYLSNINNGPAKIPEDATRRRGIVENVFRTYIVLEQTIELSFFQFWLYTNIALSKYWCLCPFRVLPIDGLQRI